MDSAVVRSRNALRYVAGCRKGSRRQRRQNHEEDAIQPRTPIWRHRSIPDDHMSWM